MVLRTHNPCQMRWNEERALAVNLMMNCSPRPSSCHNKRKDLSREDGGLKPRYFRTRGHFLFYLAGRQKLWLLFSATKSWRCSLERARLMNKVITICGPSTGRWDFKWRSHGLSELAGNELGKGLCINERTINYWRKQGKLWAGEEEKSFQKALCANSPIRGPIYKKIEFQSKRNFVSVLT